MTAADQLGVMRDRGYVHVPRKPGVPIRVQALQLGVMRLTNQASDDTTLPAAVKRIHDDPSSEVRA